LAEPHRFSVRVYYEDTDFSGNVYHAAYLKFCERARTEMLREAGIHHAELVRDGLAFAVSDMQIRFHAPAHIDDALRVETLVEGARGARLSLRQSVLRDQKLLCEIGLTVVTIRIGGGPVRLPRLVLERFG
jgi:acyl-CoA thioester hydrolase